MKVCPICGAECDDLAELCFICGAEFTDENMDATPVIDTVIENPMLAASVEDVITAEIFCDMLKENSIPYSFDDENAETGIKLLLGGSFAAINIYVGEENLEKAQDIYEQALNSQTEFDDFEEYEEEPQDI